MTATSDLQDWLALEHEAVWLYSTIGGHRPALAAASRESYAAHLATRTSLLARVHRAGVQPVVAALAYDVGSLDTDAKARAAARGLEARVASAALALVGEVIGKDRTFATAALRHAALAELTWGGKPTAFPGLP